jgi:hypothetical protein
MPEWLALQARMREILLDQSWVIDQRQPMQRNQSVGMDGCK